MSEIKIEKNVPVPDAGNGRHNYPFADMEVGDSFFLPCAKAAEAEAERNRALTSARAHAKKAGSGAKFSTRIVDGGIRVWRVK